MSKTKVTIYQCTVCPQKFLQWKTAKHHITVMHPQAEPLIKETYHYA